MSSILKNAAVAAVTRCQSSTFYNRGDNRPNPMLQALDQELKQFIGFMKKKSQPGYSKSAEPYGRPANTLFNLWNKYQPSLIPLYYEEKLLEVGDILVSMQEYKIALCQCYERYLQSYGDIKMEEISSIDMFQKTFFKNGLQAENVGLMSRAILGKSICKYQILKLDDPKLQNKQSVERCLQILSMLQHIMQVVISKESLCWLVYNGTIHIYSIARHLMSFGHSSKVLEYLLWASMCMETLVPLLTTKYISWRATLYTAVCQCYYDCKAGEQAENFARRGLLKIQELSNLEMLSSSRSSAIYVDSFRSATIRMAVMVFKRTVFENRRKPKGLLRPKTRANLKEVLNMPWPRTPTESLLVDMFDGSSAQCLAILESINDSNRRVLQTSPAALDSEPEILDVFCELVMAAQEILAGGGGNQVPGLKSQMAAGTAPLTSVTLSGSLMQLAIKGEDKVPLESIIQLLKLAYSYEHFELFDALITPVLTLIKESNDMKYYWDAKALELLSVMEKVNPSYRHKKIIPVVQDEEVDKFGAEDKNKKGGKTKAKPIEKPIEKPLEPVTTQKTFYGDELLNVAVVLMSIVSGDYEQDKIEIDLVVDATLFLWKKCRPVFQKYQICIVDNARFLHKMDNSHRWIHILSTVHNAVSWCGVSCFDPILTAEVGLRLAFLHECIANMDFTDGTKFAQRESRATFPESDSASIGNNPNANLPNQLPQGVPASANENILLAKEILEITLANINCARHTIAVNDRENIADIMCMKELCQDSLPKNIPDEKVQSGEQTPNTLKESSRKLKSTIKDLHLELIFTYHRVCLKLCVKNTAEVSDKSEKKKTKPSKGDNKENAASKTTESYVDDFNELCNKCNKNYLSKALLLAQRAITLGETQQGLSMEQKKLLEDAVSLIQRVQLEEKRIYSDNIDVKSKNTQSKTPAPPILLCLTDTYMIFKPAPFEPESGEKVAWYSIFARCATGPNVKVRLSDNSFPGTGEEVPSGCEMKVANLEPNERYVFAVAAYTDNGKLIGGHIGESTKPFLAINPLPVFSAWAYVGQMAYQVGYYNIANQANTVLWDYFVEKPKSKSSDTFITRMKENVKITLPRLNQRAVDMASPVLLRQFLASMFYSADIAIKDGQLFCDIVYDRGIFYDRQIQRLRQCERLLVSLELAGWLNEASLALQAVVQIYGLLAPILYHKIPSIPVVQILQKCHSVLLEIPPEVIKKRPSSISENLNHMIACIMYYLIKVLKGWGQKDIAHNIYESGRLLLTCDADTKLKEIKAETVEESAAKSKKGLPVPKAFSNKSSTDGSPNEELKALDAQMTCESAIMEHELNANDDPGILYAFISCMPSSSVFKEAEKFKSKPHYLEVLVHVAQKGLMDGLPDQVIQLWADGIKWLAMRNENIIGINPYINKQAGAMIFRGDDPKKFSAAMVEYKKDKGNKADKVTASKTVDKKRAKYKPLRVRPSMSEASIKKQEEIELLALNILATHFVDKYKAKKRSQHFRKIVSSELPWRSQMNIIQGLCHFNILLQKLEKWGRMLGISVNRTSYLDNEWFTLETAGTMITGWNVAPSKILMSTGAKASLESEHGQLPQTGADKHCLIELAAAVVSELSQSLVPEKEVEDATNRLDKNVYAKATEPTLTPAATQESLNKTFNYLKKAIVLAHRGQHWILLQNASRTLWNCAHTAMLHACVTSQPSGVSGPMTIDNLWMMLCRPFYVAADCLLDMLVVLQDCQEKTTKNKNKMYKDNLDSWPGNIQDERGGASLKFDPVLDDASFVDNRWIRRLVLKTLELLYSQQKYEKLVDIALRFNAITNYRYAEQVIPLLVHAQKKLKKRVMEAGGKRPPQPHYQLLQTQLGHVVYAKEYLEAQLQIQMDTIKVHMEPGVNLDPIGHGAYTELDSFRLCSVPLDTNVSLQELKDTIGQAHYTCRAFLHSRKLLCLFLAGQQNQSLLNQESSHVDFKINTEQPIPTIPPNTVVSQFSKIEEVQLSPLPWTQLGTVISSYEKTIEILQSKKLIGISAQAMHELGNICFLAQNARAANNWWCQALDIVLKTTDAVHTWRSGLKTVEDISSTFLERCGIWGCLLAAVLSANIAQYTVTNDHSLRIEYCLLSGYLFKALLCSSIPHPKADRDYALYDVGEGCDMTSLTPGIDFMSDRFRCDGRQLVAALKWTTEELSRAQHNLFVLPLLTLNQYFTTCVCHDVKQSVESRILRVRVLTDLGLYSEAIVTLQKLLSGEHLPQIGDTNFRQKEKSSDMTNNTTKSPGVSMNQKTPDENKVFELFNTSKAIWNKNNYLVIESLFNRRLPSSLSALFGPHLSCYLALVQAHLFVSLANTIPVLPKGDGIQLLDKNKQESNIPMDRSFSKQNPFAVKATASSKAPDGETNDILDLDFPSIFSSGTKILTLETIKGMILAAAEQIVTNILNVVTEKSQKDQHGSEVLSAAELEVVLQCHLEQASIAQQRHHAPLAALIMLGALKKFQSASIFKKKKATVTPRSPSSIKSSSARGSHKPTDANFSQADMDEYQYQNLQARTRLDLRLWMQCKYQLVQSLMMEVRGMGEIMGSENKVISDLGDCRLYCAESIGEAEVCADREMQANCLFLAAQLNLIDGKCLKQTISLFEDAIKNLNFLPQCSDKGEQILINCIIFKTDLETLANTQHNSDFLRQTLNNYLEAQRIILKKMESLGEKIEYHNPISQTAHMTTPDSPLQNIYLPYVQSLVEVKLRIGHAIARICAKKINNNVADIPLLSLEDGLGVLATALEISQISASRNATLESEILLIMGKVQKIMVCNGDLETRAAARTFIKAIKLSYINGHDLGLIRQAYLEIALTYLQSLDLKTEVEDSYKEPVTEGASSLSSQKIQEPKVTAGPEPTKVNADPEPTKVNADPEPIKVNADPEPTKVDADPESKKFDEGPEPMKVKAGPGPMKADAVEELKARKVVWLAIHCASAVAYAQKCRTTISGNKSVSSDKIIDKALVKLPEFLPMDLLNRNLLGKKVKIFKNEIEEELDLLVESQEVKVNETYSSQVIKVKSAAKALTWIHLLGYQSILQRLVSSGTFSLSGHKDNRRCRDDRDLKNLKKTNLECGTTNPDILRYMFNSGEWSIRLSVMHSYLSANLIAYADECNAPYIPAGLCLPQQSQTSVVPKITMKSYIANTALNFDVNLGQFSNAELETVKALLPPGSNLDFNKVDAKISTLDSEPEMTVQWYQSGIEEDASHQSDSCNPQATLLYSFADAENKFYQGFKWIALDKVYELHDKLATLAQKEDCFNIVKKEDQSSSSHAKNIISHRDTTASSKIEQYRQLEIVFKHCLDDAWKLIKGTPRKKEKTDPEFNIDNIKHMESIFDPNLGLTLKGTDLLPWLIKLFT